MSCRGGISIIGDAVAVFARDLCCIETIDGLVDRGGDGKLVTPWASIDVLMPKTACVGAIDGDCSGE